MPSRASESGVMAMRRDWLFVGMSCAVCLLVIGLTVGVSAAAARGGAEAAPSGVVDYGLAGTVQIEVKAAGKLGSGFFVSPDGYLLTCAHVVADSATVTVRTAAKRTFEGTVVARDAKHDLAVVKVPARNVPAQVLGDSSALHSGESAVALGSPLGLEGTVTSGVVSNVARKVGDQTLIQTDVPVNPGLSGGPLLNTKGQVIGVVAAMVQKAQDVGFAVPINDAAEVLAKAGVPVSVVPSNRDLAYQESKTPVTPSPPAKTPRGRLLWPLFIALGVALLLAVVWFLVLRRPRRGEPGGDVRIALRDSGAVTASSPPRSEPAENLDDVDIELH